MEQELEERTVKGIEKLLNTLPIVNSKGRLYTSPEKATFIKYRPNKIYFFSNVGRSIERVGQDSFQILLRTPYLGLCLMMDYSDSSGVPSYMDSGPSPEMIGIVFALPSKTIVLDTRTRDKQYKRKDEWAWYLVREKNILERFKAIIEQDRRSLDKIYKAREKKKRLKVLQEQKKIAQRLEAEI